MKRKLFALTFSEGLCIFALVLCMGALVKELQPVLAAPNVQTRPLGVTSDTPALTIAAVTVDSVPTPSSNAREAEVQLTFGTVTGTYTTCTMQAKTTYDGTNYLTLGSGAAVTVTSNTVNAWTIIEQLGTTTVTTSSVSSTAALGFGLNTKFTFNCSGAFGTTAPATLSVIYR